jgi:hypothetical protein
LSAYVSTAILVATRTRPKSLDIFSSATMRDQRGPVRAGTCVSISVWAVATGLAGRTSQRTQMELSSVDDGKLICYIAEFNMQYSYMTAECASI